jgi:hypothetical protein
MLQQTSLPPAQSLSILQSFSAEAAGSHTFAVPSRDGWTHAWPEAVSQSESPAQNFGQALASWQTFPPDP